MSTDLLSRMNSSVSKAQEAAQATFDVLTGVVDVPVNVNGMDVPTLATRVRDFLGAGSGVLDGVDGKSLEFIEVRADGHLWAKIEDQVEVDLGEIVPTGVDFVQYDDVTGELVIQLTDGTQYGPFNIKGDSAAEVVEAYIEEGDLVLKLANDSIVNAGDITRFGGAGANGADITENGDLVILFSDGTIENVGKVKGDKGANGYSLVSAGIDQFGVLRFLRSDGKTSTAGLVNASIVDNSGNTVVDVRLGGVDDKELIIELESTTINIGKVVGDDGIDGLDGADGLGIQSFTTVDGELIITLTDASTHNAGPIQVTRVFNAGDVSIGDAEIVNGELVIEFDVNGTLQTLNLGNVLGTDGTVLASAEIDVNSDLVFTDSVGNFINAGAVEQVNITSVDVDIDGYLVVVLTNGTTFTSTNPVKGADGTDADGINGATINASGELIISFEGGAIPDANLGVVVASVETNVDLIDGRELTFTMSDGQTFGPFNVRGDDGIYLVSARVEEGQVYVTYSNDETTEIGIGNVAQNPETATVNPDGTLTIAFSDGTSLSTTERVQAFDGDTITGVTFDGVANTLTIDHTTDNRDNTAQVVIDNVVGYQMTDMYVDNVPVVPQLVIETNIPTLEEVRIDIPKGIDGGSIVGFEQRGNDLVIKYTARGDATTELEFVAEDVYAEGSIESITVDGNGDLVINVDILQDPLVFETLQGADGNTITSIVLSGTNNRDLVISSRDDAPVTIPEVRGEDGVTITDVVVNGTNLEISVSDRVDPIIFPQEKGIDAQEAIVDIRLDGRDLIIEKTSETLTVPLLAGEDGNTITDINIVDGVLTINLSDTTVVTFDLATIAGVDGVTIDNIEIDVNDILQISVSDGSTVSFDMNTLRGVDGKSIAGIALGGADNRDLIIDTNLAAPSDQIVIPGVKGEDGLTVSSIDTAANARDIEVVMSDVTTVYTLSDAAVHIIDARIENNKLVIELNDLTKFTSTEDVVGRDGDGTGVSDVSFVDGGLTVTLIDAAGTETDIEAGDVSMVGVAGARIVEDPVLNEGILWIDLADGTPIEVGNVYGENGKYVTSVDLQPQVADPSKQDLILTFNDTTTINAGNATGNPGRSISTAEVQFGGDMIVGYDDGTFENVGNVGSGAGLSVWDIEKRPYVEDQVVIHDGGLYMSRIAANNDTPPSGNWRALALGDQIVEVRTPTIITPRDGNSAFSTRPLLSASVFAAIVSSDQRDYREFQVDAIAGDYTAPVYTWSGDTDSHAIEGFDLTIDTEYKWRVRDVAVSGYVSDWSLEASFLVPAGVVEVPTVSISVNESSTDAFLAPEFNTSVFSSLIGADTHTETDWQVSDGDVVVWESLNDVVNLESVIIPFGILEKLSSYQVRAKHRGTTVESGWSDWSVFTTSGMDYAITPSVTGDSQNFVASPFTKTTEFEAYPSVGLDLDRAVWLVTRVDTGEVVATETKTSNMRNFELVGDITPNVDYQVTVEYQSDRFGAFSSLPFVFEFVRSIATPTLSTLEDINAFPVGGVVSSSEFGGVNETHISSDWELRDLNSDELIWSSYGDVDNLTSVSIPLTTEESQRDLTVQVRHNGEFLQSEWSVEFSFFTEEISIVGPGPQTLVAGDMIDGFFGEVAVTELFSGDELASAIGLSVGISQHSNEPWLKFAIDNKIVYIAKKPYRHSVSHDDINAANAVYASQNTIVSKGDDSFIVRLPTGGHADPVTRDYTLANSNSGEGSEWNRLMYRVHVDVPTGTEGYDGGPQIGENWVEYTDADIVVGSGNGRASWTQEDTTVQAGSRILRGSSLLSYLFANTSSSATSFRGWRPALELVV